MKEIHVKTHIHWFCMWISRRKSFEIRKNDRDYQTGDKIIQYEVDPETKRPTGRVGVGNVGYVLHQRDFPNGLQPGYVVIEAPFEKMVIKPKPDNDPYG